jgi:hypothetical protein
LPDEKVAIKLAIPAGIEVLRSRWNCRAESNDEDKKR